jgi:preprotein translocase SecE subunit
MSTKASGSGTVKPGTPSRPAARDRAARNLQIRAFAQGLASEMRRVTWPTRQEWVSATILTIGLVVILGFYTFSLDELFTWVFGLVHH